MTPWDLIVWAGAAAISLVIVGVGAAIAVMLVQIARGRI